MEFSAVALVLVDGCRGSCSVGAKQRLVEQPGVTVVAYFQRNSRSIAPTLHVTLEVAYFTAGIK